MSEKQARAQRRTAHAEAAIRRAHRRTEELAGHPAACIELFMQLFLPVVAPHLRAFAEAEFRRNIQDEQFRLEFVLWAYQGALELYAAGALD